MDLHLHSKHSDGTMTVEEIFEQAKKLNIKYLSITDHDTIKGVEEGQDIAPRHNINLIPGVEINTEYNEKEVHVLGYFMDIKNLKLTQALDSLRNGRLERVTRIVNKLQNLAIRITLEDVLKESMGDSIGRPHVARALIKLGHGDSISEIFDKYLDIHKPAYVERFKLSPYDAVKLIRDAGGIAVLAHPKLVYDEELVDELLPHFDGLEVYHSEQDLHESHTYEQKALKNHLVITGGSDCHGAGKNGDFLLGTVKIPELYISKIRNIHKERLITNQ